eukprot:gene16786-19964_t
MGNRAFKSHHGTYLSAEGDRVFAHKGHLNNPQYFYIENHGDKISLRTCGGNYVSIDGHRVYVSTQFHGEHSLYHLEHHGHHVAIRGHHHKYLGIDHHGHVTIHHERGHNESFEEHHV